MYPDTVVGLAECKVYWQEKVQNARQARAILWSALVSGGLGNARVKSLGGGRIQWLARVRVSSRKCANISQGITHDACACCGRPRCAIHPRGRFAVAVTQPFALAACSVVTVLSMVSVLFVPSVCARQTPMPMLYGVW